MYVHNTQERELVAKQWEVFIQTANAPIIGIDWYRCVTCLAPEYMLHLNLCDIGIYVT